MIAAPGCSEGHAAGSGSAPAASASAALPELPWAREAVPAVAALDGGATTADAIELGHLLFYDPIVSSDRETACATCHSEAWGMSDGLPVSIGTGGGRLAGPGRKGSNTTRRNAPTLWNVAYRSRLFWDGRAASLEDQVHFPFDSSVEFARSLDDVVRDVAAIPDYADRFRKAFPGADPPVTADTFARAIAAFERTLVSANAPYDAYATRDPGAMTASMIDGMNLFAESGCADCHAPPLFTSDRYEDRGIAAIPGVVDEGRFEATGDPADRGRFEVPMLRNARDSSPYFHTGAVASLEDAVRMEVAFSVANAGIRPLDDGEILDVVAFIGKALYDASRSPDRPSEVPSGFPVPIDGFSVRR
jgi:cytochrome c peroxidase